MSCSTIFFVVFSILFLLAVGLRALPGLSSIAQACARLVKVGSKEITTEKIPKIGRAIYDRAVICGLLAMVNLGVWIISTVVMVELFGPAAAILGYCFTPVFGMLSYSIPAVIVSQILRKNFRSSSV